MLFRIANLSIIATGILIWIFDVERFNHCD